MEAKEELINALDTEDDLGKVIRSQIVIEYILIQIIESKLSDASYLNKMDLTFEQTTNLALALGLDNAWAKPLGCLGTIRNGFAHKIRGEINKSDANNFYKSFSSGDKAAMKKLYDEREEDLIKIGYPKYKDLEPVHKFTLCVTILTGALQAWLNSRAS